MLPLRMVGAYLGYEVQWDGKTGIVVQSPSRHLQLTLEMNRRSYTLNGVSKTLHSAPLLKADRVYLPARDMAELCGRIDWKEGQVFIYPEKAMPTYRMAEDGTLLRHLNDKEPRCLCRKGKRFTRCKTILLKSNPSLRRTT